MNPPPPLPWLLAYRLLNLRLPEQYRPWVAQDVAGKTFMPWQIARTLLWLLTTIGLYAVGQHATYAWPTTKALWILAVFALAWALFASRAALVKKTLRWQRIDKRGAPRRPKKLAVLSNAEAVVLAVALLVLLTNAAALFGDRKAPKGLAAAKCDQPSQATIDRIAAGITHKGATVAVAQSIEYATGEVVGVVLKEQDAAGGTKGRGQFELIFVQGGELFTYRLTGIDPWTGFPAPTVADRISNEVIARVLQCLGNVASR